MDRVNKFVKATLVGGLLVVLPIGVVVMLASHLVATVRSVLTPVVSRLLPYHALFPGLLAGVILLALCFVTGLVLQVGVGRRIRLGLERRVLERLPGYTLLKSLSQRAIGETEGLTLAPALFETGEGLMPAFVVEEHDDGYVTVFVPAVPTPTAGQIYIVERGRVHAIDVPLKKVFTCVSKWGVGSAELLKTMGPGKADCRTSVEAP